jgi:hypothetical protein
MAVMSGQETGMPAVNRARRRAGCSSPIREVGFGSRGLLAGM